ncbi:MAG: (4Fe-4S)-binding protein [Candidatus Omnitrophota bacterium]|nr:MAG: (4Fe-4S)-binding protein [Candidatus Omnitrophota bacterium]
MIISVASGKGGTGKTTIAVSLALSLENVQFIDCDVEEPNAHIFLKPAIKERKKAHVLVPEIDLAKCTFCGKCAQICVYNALAVLPPADNNKKGNILVFEQLCHSCGACTALCPENAIKEVNREIGAIEYGSSIQMDFIHGKLNIGEAMSPPLIRQVKQQINPEKTVIIDAPPGTSCPVIASIQESDYSILVTEPTPFGLNDLVLAVEVLRKLKIPFGVVINRADLGNDKTEKYCQKEKIPILMKVPFKKEIAQVYSKGEALVQAFPEYRKEFRGIFETIKNAKPG